MKKLLCYLGILILLGLVLLPPTLRIVLSPKEEKEKTIVESSKILSCSNDILITKTKYDNEKISMIVIKKIISDEEDKDTSKSNDVIKTFESIKNNGNITYNILEDGEVISIDYTVTNHDDLAISNITQNIEDQQLYYENQGLTCSIR